MAELKNLIVNGLTRLVGDAIYKTHTAGDNSDKIASTKYVKTAVDSMYNTSINGKFKPTLTAITTDPAASGTANTVVTSVKQNAAGVITVSRANLPTIGAANLTIKVNGTTKGTFSANATSAVTLDITKSDLGLSSAMNFVGLTSTTMSDGQTTNPTVSGYTTFTAGDVVIDPTETEFIRDNAATPKWHKLGDANSYALANNVVNNITVKGDTWITPNPTTSQKGTVTVTLSHKALTSYSAKGSTTKVPQITTDAAGHVTTITEQNIAFPSITISTSGSGNVISDLTTNGHQITITKNNISVSDTKQSISASTEKIYLTGVTTTSTTSVGYANANVYMSNSGLVASSLSVTNATVSGTATISTAKITNLQATTSTLSNVTITNATVSTMTVSTINGTTVGNSPKFTDTDEKVKQSSSTTNQFMPILGAYAATPTSGTNGQVYYNKNIAINTAANTIKVNACQITYDAAEDCMKFTFNN